MPRLAERHLEPELTGEVGALFLASLRRCERFRAPIDTTKRHRFLVRDRGCSLFAFSSTWDATRRSPRRTEFVRVPTHEVGCSRLPPRSSRDYDAANGQPASRDTPLTTAADKRSAALSTELRGQKEAICRSFIFERRRILYPLLDPLHGKEGVDGSSPSEGFRKSPANGPLCCLSRRRAGVSRVRDGYIFGRAGTRRHARLYATNVGARQFSLRQ